MSQIVRISFDMHGLSLGLGVANVKLTLATQSPKLKPCMSKLFRTICDIDETTHVVFAFLSAGPRADGEPRGPRADGEPVQASKCMGCKQ